MTKLALLLLAFGTLTTGCAGIGTKRPSGGAQIQKTAQEADKNVPVETPFEQRADLGQ